MQSLIQSAGSTLAFRLMLLDKPCQPRLRRPVWRPGKLMDDPTVPAVAQQTLDVVKAEARPRLR